jgi:hypothetical protein
MLHVFPESAGDRELRELFNVCWSPAGVTESLPITPDVQSMPNGRYGNIFDVLVDRPDKMDALLKYPVVWATGDTDLAPLTKRLGEYVRKGGTLVLTAEAAKPFSESFLGFKFNGKTERAETWTPGDSAEQAATPFQVIGALVSSEQILASAGKFPLLVRNAVGTGAVITILVPRGLGLDERAHPVLPYLMNGLTRNLLPVDVRNANGKPLSGEIMFQVNRTKDGYVVLLVNNRGVDKTQHGIARVDRRQFVDVVVEPTFRVKSAKEYTDPRDLKLEAQGIAIRVHPGDVQVIGLVKE